MRNYIDRRRVLTLLGAAGATGLLRTSSVADAATITCSSTSPPLDEGPYFVEEKLLRSDIRTDSSTGAVQPGVPLTLTLTVQNGVNGSCAPLAGALIDIWHANYQGNYADERNLGTLGLKYLRGYQITDQNGAVRFTTVYPG